jgi:hypothetical protein
MAAGAWTFTDAARTNLLNGDFDLDTNTFFMALFLSTSNIGAASTTYAGLTDEVTQAFGYLTGGVSMGALTLSGASGTVGGVINGVTLTAFERRMSNKTGPTRDPGYLDSTSQFVSRVPDRAPRLTGITGSITFGSGAMTVSAYKCGQDYDGDRIVLKPVTTTAVGQTWAAGTDLPAEGIVGADGDRIVVRFYNATAAPTAPLLTLLGDVGVLS